MLRSDVLFPKPTRVVRMTEAELLKLPEYSTSLPTGQTIGKRWRRDDNFMARRNVGHLHFFDGYLQPEDYGVRWVIGEYVSDTEPGYIGISWARVELIKDP